MNLDTSIPMMSAGGGQNFLGQQADAINLAAGMQQMQRQNALADLYKQHGAGIVSGDPNAINALAQVDPSAALAIKSERALGGQRQATTALRQEQLEQERAQGARAVEKHAMEMSAAELEREMAETLAHTRMLGEAHAMGNEEAFNQIIQQEGLEPIPFEMFPIAAARIEGAMEAYDGALKRHQGSPDDSAAEQKIARLVNDYGLDRRTAVGVVDGVLDMAEDGTVVNVATGERIGQVQAPRQPEGQAPTAENVEGALGVQGITTGAVNSIADFIGIGQPFEGSAEASTQLDSLATRTVQTLSAEWPGRPSNLTREMIEDLTVRPGGRTGFDGALNKFRNMRREVSRAVASAQSAVNNDGYTTQQRAEARAALDDLLPLLSDYNALIVEMEKRGGGKGKTSSGIEWSIEE